MEQKRKSFETSLKKGELGEQIIREYLEDKGWIVYFPFTKDRPHYFDLLATKDKEKVFAMDVKTKARFNNFPKQGINIKSYNEYMNFANKANIPFYIVFVDDKNGDVHFSEIKDLTNGVIIKNVIAWDISTMKFLFNIGEERVKMLSLYDQRSYDFLPCS